MRRLQVSSIIWFGAIGIWLPLASALAQEAGPVGASPAAAEPPALIADGSESQDKAKKKEEAWRTLLPAMGLEGWEITDFGTQGKVRRDGEQLILEMGDPLTGINLKKPAEFAKSNYEISLECQRIEGNDFLCGLTFPVGDEFCSFIAGGWGGGLVGLSSINGMDASENSTSSYLGFDNGKWYKFRIRVDELEVRAWIDDKEVIRQERDGYEFSTRIEVYASQPLGLSVFRSTVAVKDFKWRPLANDKAEKAGEATAEKSDQVQSDNEVKNVPPTAQSIK